MDNWKSIWLRLPYGGAYSNAKEETNNILKFLPKFFEFQDKLYGNVKKLIAKESMGDGYYKVITPDDKIFEVRKSFLLNPDFQRFLSQLDSIQ